MATKRQLEERLGLLEAQVEHLSTLLSAVADRVEREARYLHHDMEGIAKTARDDVGSLREARKVNQNGV